jgi:hypothetical protein
MHFRIIAETDEVSLIPCIVYLLIYEREYFQATSPRYPDPVGTTISTRAKYMRDSNCPELGMPLRQTSGKSLT